MKRPVLNYTCLLVMLAAAVVYQWHVTEYWFPRWFHNPNGNNTQPFVVEPSRQGLRVSQISPEAARAGLKPGDILSAVNGKPATGIAVLSEALAATVPGGKFNVAIESRTARGQLASHEIALTKPPAQATSALSVLVFLIMPMFCFALGFWVAFIRPRDHLAWLLLALMISFAASFPPGAEFWGPGSRDFGAAYHGALSNTLPIWMFLFGLYFPEPFRVLKRKIVWKAACWVVLAPLAAFALLESIIAVGATENYRSILFALGIAIPLAKVCTALSFIAFGAFFALVFAKGRMATSRDARRRLMVVSAGSCISLALVLVLAVISTVKGTPIDNSAPHWLTAIAFSLLFLFPLTLTYVIVVDKAMDVRVAIRQGLRYTVVKNGIIVLRVVFVSVLVILMIDFMSHPEGHRFLPWLVLGGGIGVITATAPLTHRLTAWADRKFFRDAYNAEMVLSDLGEKVRRIIETNPLLETVCQAIADTLHVPSVAALIFDNDHFAPAYALGYSQPPDVSFPAQSGTVRYLASIREPVHIHPKDRHSWIYWRSGMTREELARLSALHAKLLLPLTTRDELLGFISLSEKRSEEPFSGSDVRLLKSVATQTGLALENARLSAAMVREAAQREKLNRELEIAREVQERLFPQKLPTVPGLDYCGTCRTALGVGGDYFDFLALPGGKLGVAVGDVSGKGIAAALMMASLQASLRGEAARADGDLAGLVANVNRMVYEASSVNRYATFFYGQYEPSSRRLTYVNAGHNPPFVFHKSGTDAGMIRLETGGTVVGVIEHASYAQETVSLEAGDVFVAYTDGITESMNPHDEEWGEERFLATLGTALDLPASEMASRIMNTATQFASGAPQHDDMTLVILRVNG